MKKIFNLLIKCAFAALAFYIVYKKADLSQVMEHIKDIKLPYLFLSFVVLNGAQLVSAFRMRYYFESAGLPCSRHFSIALYYIGMFFNTMLPGGIGGDGYKIWAMSRLERFPKRTSFRLMISNRTSGLFLLLLFTFALTFFSDFFMAFPHAALLLVTGCIVMVIGYFLSAKWLLKESMHVALGAARYSFIIQGCCMISAMLIFYGMGIEFSQTQEYINYLIIFMISSIVSILPISIGGAGLREVTFLYGAHHIGLSSSFGIAFSLVYFAINMLLSLLGLIFISDLKNIHQKQKGSALQYE